MSGANVRSDLTFYYSLVYTARHQYGTPQIILPTERWLQFESKNYCVLTEDVKLLRRNLRACLQEVTSSFCLFKLARSGLQMIKYFFTGTNYSDLNGIEHFADRRAYVSTGIYT